MGWQSIARKLRELKRTYKRHAHEARRIDKNLSVKKKSIKLLNTVQRRVRKSHREKLKLQTASTKSLLSTTHIIGGYIIISPTLVITYTSNNTPISNISKLMSKASVSKAPVISILNTVANAQYLIIMTDPDAPMGTFTHMISVYNGNTKKTFDFIPYYPPTPPSGTHRYITEMYDFTNKTITELPTFTDNLSYTSIIMNYIKSQSLKKVGNTVQFTVKSG